MWTFKYRILVILVLTIQSIACSQSKSATADPKPDSPSETRVIYAKDPVERADEMCKKEGNCENAIVLYSQALENNKNSAEIYAKRAMAYYALKDFDNAIADFTTAIELKPKGSADWYFFRGLTKSLLPNEQRTEACADFRSAKKWGYKPANDPQETKSFNKWVSEYCSTKNLIF